MTPVCSVAGLGASRSAGKGKKSKWIAFANQCANLNELSRLKAAGLSCRGSSSSLLASETRGGFQRNQGGSFGAFFGPFFSQKKGDSSLGRKLPVSLSGRRRKNFRQAAKTGFFKTAGCIVGAFFALPFICPFFPQKKGNASLLSVAGGKQAAGKPLHPLEKTSMKGFCIWKTPPPLTPVNAA